jgi:nucleoside-diphosphate-sugar epimerase
VTRVLVTGASGFVGRPATDALVRAGYEVHAVARSRQRDRAPDARWHVADLLDPAATTALVDDVRAEALLHLAWIATPPIYWTSPENRTWVDASLHLVRAFHGAGGNRVVVAGTGAEYEWSPPGGELICHEASTPLQPATLYGASKLELSRRLSDVAEETGLSAAWGRLFWMYGPGEHPDRLVPGVASALLAGREALCSAGEQARDFLHVADAGAALARLVAAPVSGTVNIGSGRAVRVKDVVEILGRLCQASHLLRLGARPGPEGEPASIAADVTRLRVEVGFEPTFSLEDGLRDTVDHLRGHA